MTIDHYPKGGITFEDCYEDALLGIPVKRHNAARDYLNRIRLKHDVDDLDHQEMMRGWAIRVETPDKEP